MSDFVKVYSLPEKERKTAEEFEHYNLNFNIVFRKTYEKLNKDFDDYFTECLYTTYKEQDISKVIVLSLPEFKNFLFQMLPLYNGFKSPDEVISRNELCEAVDRIFGSEEKFLDIIEEDIPSGYHYYKYEGEEIYIIDHFHNRYINWYKLTHVGRDFHTDMKTKEEVIDFLQNLHDKWLMENEDE
jgi:hypothetical protein